MTANMTMSYLYSLLTSLSLSAKALKVLHTDGETQSYQVISEGFDMYNAVCKQQAAFLVSVWRNGQT